MAPTTLYNTPVMTPVLFSMLRSCQNPQSSYNLQTMRPIHVRALSRYLKPFTFVLYIYIHTKQRGHYKRPILFQVQGAMAYNLPPRHVHQS